MGEEQSDKLFPEIPIEAKPKAQREFDNLFKDRKKPKNE